MPSPGIGRRFAGLLIAGTLAGSVAPAQTASRELALVERLPAASTPATKPQARSAYLLVYFKDETHSLHFATSSDGYAFTDVNGGRPVLSGARIAEQRGIRDPYMTRGPDGSFYMMMTDLHIRAREEGLREAEWDRPADQYGWGNNRALILMRSRDLLHWTHADVRVDRLFATQKDIGAAWAPEAIYDPLRDRMMVYYSTRRRNETLYMVYSYADRDFTTLSTAPRELFSHPTDKVMAIDGDITKIGGTYHLFFGSNIPPARVEHATSKRINGGYVIKSGKVNPETVDTEAPNVWRRRDGRTYVLMYDVFGAKPLGNMGFSETRDFVHFRDLGHFNDPGSPMKATNFSRPKHGAVVAITPQEKERLERFFGG